MYMGRCIQKQTKKTVKSKRKKKIKIERIFIGSCNFDSHFSLVLHPITD